MKYLCYARAFQEIPLKYLCSPLIGDFAEVHTLELQAYLLRLE